jgi:hypothetical protein
VKQTAIHHVPKVEYAKLANSYGLSGVAPRCPRGCDFTYFKSATKTAPSAFVCHVCKTEIRGS